MSDVISHAEYLINRLLEEEQHGDLELRTACNDFKVFRETSRQHEWTPLFIHQLKRLMDCNESFERSFWLLLHDDIRYFLDKLHSQQSHRYWTRFQKRMELENKLMQRESQFKKIYGERKTLHQLCQEHRLILLDYLEKCISLHSKIQVQEFIENIDNFLRDNYEQKNLSLTSSSREHLQNEFKSIKINFDCSNTSLDVFKSTSHIYSQSANTINSSRTDFLPSVEQLNFERNNTKESITKLLESKRWLVILGDPGHAKTTLLRWITHMFANIAHLRIEFGSLKGSEKELFRIPILIRVGEFAEWFQKHPELTLFDYIGQHTWFSQLYNTKENEYTLKEFIVHGYALILLDGLDEIHDLKRKNEVCTVVQQFLTKYTCTSHFLSPFDDPFYSAEELLEASQSFSEMQPANMAVGNQIIITSRIVGYQLHPLNGSFMVHSVLLPLTNQEAYEFVNSWMEKVQRNVTNILLKNGVQIPSETYNACKVRRNNSLKDVLHKDSKISMLNPSVLSAICISIFVSSKEFHPKCRIQVYNHIVQMAIRTWNNQKSNISENILVDFLIDLAVYLHIQSPSGLIDEFDMKNLCYLTFKRHTRSANHVELRQFTGELISLLGSNVGIVAERGLQVFGFLHLLFQEYFIARALIQHSSEVEIIKRFLGIAVYPHSREPLLLTIGWISWRWSSEKYNNFCRLLLQQKSKNYVIPFGVLVFFDAFDDMYILPSDDIIFMALNILLDHSFYYMFTNHCLTALSKLSQETKLKWMQLHLTDEKRFKNFCQFLLAEDAICRVTYVENVLSPTLSEQLWLISSKNISNELILEQTFRRILSKTKPFDDIVRNDLTSLFVSRCISSANIHPLIFSVIIAIQGGLARIDAKQFKTIQFSPRRMIRQSSVLIPIIDYFNNTNDSHSIKVQILIDQYTNNLRQSSSEDISLDVIDTFLALICLRGLSQPLDYKEFDGYKALPLALNKFKRNLFYIKRLYQSDSNSEENKLYNLSEMESIINKFYSQSNISNEQLMRFSLACAATWNKLGIKCLPDALEFEVFQTNNIAQYLECQPEFEYQPEFGSSSNERKINQMYNGIHPLQIIQNTPYFLLICVPQSLQPLYYHLTMASIDQVDSLPLVVLLVQCLTFLEDVAIEDSDYRLMLSILESSLREYKLGRYAAVLFGQDRSIPKHKTYSERDQYLPQEWEQFISEVQQMTEDENDMQLFAASISLAGLYRAQHRCDQDQSMKYKLSINKSEEVYLTITRIGNPILRILASNTVLNMKNPSVFDEKQEDEVRSKMIHLLKNCFTGIPLLTSTLLFIQCYRHCELFPVYLQEIIIEMITKLNYTSTDKRSQEAAYIALKSVNNTDLLDSLSQFEKHTRNLSDLLQFNSTIFYNYMMNTTSFDTTNHLFLSLMYLAEITADVQILQMYCKKKTVRFVPDLLQLWNDSSKSEKRMTFQMATLITDYLQSSNWENIEIITFNVASYRIVDKMAYPVINKWLEYQNVKDLKCFAYYAAYLSVREGQNTPLFIDMIKNVSDYSHRYFLTEMIKNLLEFDSVDSIPILTNLADIIQSAYQSSLWATACIRSKEIFELILNNEYKRIIGDTNNSSTTFFRMINDCSLTVQNYLAEYFSTFLESNHISNATEDVYLAVIITWVISIMSFFHTKENFSNLLYEYIFIFVYDQRYPQVQKSILNAFAAVFVSEKLRTDHIFMGERVLITLEKIIDLYTTTTHIYSEDILNSCLLAFGNRLLRSKSFKMNQIISTKMQNILEILFKTSSSDCISARALLCLIFSENSAIIFRTISNYLTTMPELTPNKRYTIFVQQLLYKTQGISRDNDTDEIVQLIQTYPDELLDKFIIDFYKDLCNTTNNNGIINPTPDYTIVAMKFISVDVVMFRIGVKKTIDEEKFKTELYNANKKCYNRLYIILYASFGVITNELIDMLACYSTEVFAYFDDSTFQNIKDIFDRSVIESLFKHLQSILDPEDALYTFLFKLAFQFAQANLISAFEMHECASSILNKTRTKIAGGFSLRSDTRDPLNSLICLSCIKKDSLWPSPVIFFNEDDIDKSFHFNDKSILYLRRNYFIQNFACIPYV